MKNVITGTLAGVALLGGGTGIADQAQNPYLDKGAHYELPIQADIAQGDHVEIAKDSPEVTLSRWNDEERITITPNLPGTGAIAKASRPLLSKKMQFTRGTATAFVQPAATSSDFDIDFSLDAKPASNVFTYTIAGAEDLDFVYQPPLDEEFANDPTRKCTPTECTSTVTGKVTDQRPENVVGTYAVYSKTKKNHKEAATNYGTGKLFHIYRPKAIDASGNETWATLQYKDGTLSVTVPQSYLDSATYPVTVDPTFGYTTIGASNSNFPNDYYVCFPYTSPSDAATANDVVIYVQGSGSASVKGVILSSANTIITNGIGAAVAASTPPNWFTSTLTSTTISPSTSYKLCAIGIEGSNQVGYKRDANVGGQYALNSYASPTNPAGLTAISQQWSVYVDYSAGGGGAAPDDGLILFQ